MNSDTLFLLDAQSFKKEDLVRFCPACAMVEGYLNYYPQVGQAITVVRVSPVRPRAEIVRLLGEENQGSPVLVLSDNAQLPEEISIRQANGYRFIDDERHILVYLGLTYHGGLPLSY